jgi:hypothetical protein
MLRMFVLLGLSRFQDVEAFRRQIEQMQQREQSMS